MKIADVAKYYMENPFTERTVAEKLFLNVVNGMNGNYQHDIITRCVKQPRIAKETTADIEETLSALFFEAGIGFDRITVLVTKPTETNNYHSYSAVVENTGKIKERNNA